MLNKNKIRGLIGTIIFHAIIVVLLFVFGFTTQLPLPGEEGMEVNFGDSDFGMDNINPDKPSDIVSLTQPSNNNDDSYAQSNDDESVNLNTNRNRPTPTRPTPPQERPTPTPPVEQPPQYNPHAEYKPRSNQGGSEGINGQPGNQGRAGGSLDSPTYQGLPGSGGSGSGGSGGGGGMSYKLGTRKASVLPKPDYKSDEQGDVVVKIWVDQQGNVTKAQAGEQGTTASDNNLWRLAETAAKKAKFTPDPNAPEIQTGTITYKFLKLN